MPHEQESICYDVGRVMVAQNWHPMFDVDQMHREFQIMKDHLHCNAVRICGQDIDRLVTAGHDALDLVLEVWISPEVRDNGPSRR